MEANLVHGEGDLEGEPYRLAPHLLRLLYRWFEYDPATDLYRHRKGVVGWPKGSAKTEFEAALGLEHLEGPSRKRGTRVVNVNAVDGDQADEIVARAGMMIPKGSDLESRLQVVNGLITQRQGSGLMRALSSAIGKNDGKLPSLVLNDELHEWDTHSTAGAKRHGVQERGTNKRAGSRQLNVSTAGWTLESLLGGMYQYGVAVAEGRITDPSFLFEWWEAAEDLDLDDPDVLLRAILECNPMTQVMPDLADNLVRSYHEHRLRGEELDFVRYHLNRWAGVNEDAWMDVALWIAAKGTRPVPARGTPIVLGFDGSYKRDSTALVGATVERKPHVFVVAVWERPEESSNWRVPVSEVLEEIRRSCRRWNVKELAADVSYWQTQMADLESSGVVTVEEFQQSPKRLAAACARMYEHVIDGLMTHDGDPRLQRHIANCRRHETEWGVRVVKEHTKSRRYIDLAVAAIQAHDRAFWWATAAGANEPLFAVT